MSRWSPRELPRARSQTWQILAYGDPSGNRPELTAGFMKRGLHVAAADLYWATPDMTALSVAAGRDLPEVCWSVEYRPSRTGLLVFDGGICRGLDISGMQQWAPELLHADPFHKQGRPPRVELPLDAVSWHAAPTGRLEITTWMRWSEMRAALSAAGAYSDLYDKPMPPLLPVQGWAFAITPESAPSSEMAVNDDMERTVSLAVAAAWSLMQQPKISDRTVRHAAGKDARRAARMKLPDSDVTIVDLRKIYRPQEPSEDAEGAQSRTYRHRWVVSGHWRSQPYGKEHSLRRQQWIPSHTKGPDGAPLLETERVNVWRR